MKTVAVVSIEQSDYDVSSAFMKARAKWEPVPSIERPYITRYTLKKVHYEDCVEPSRSHFVFEFEVET